MRIMLIPLWQNYKDAYLFAEIGYIFKLHRYDLSLDNIKKMTILLADR